jgi:hypothetical protein
VRWAALVLALALPASAPAEENLRAAVVGGGTVDFVGPSAGWWAAAEAWFGRHGLRVDGFGVRGAILLEGSYQAMVGNAWPNIVASVRIGAGADVREPVPVFAAGGGLMIGPGLLPRPLALAARLDAHLLVRDDRPHMYVTVTLGVGAAF